MIRWLSRLLLLALMAACAPRPAIEPPATETPAPAKSLDAAMGVVDFSCAQDSDCAVKNVGNCCGHAPACVNASSPTFPEQVRARCEAEGSASICGFRDIQSCQCVNQRCEGVNISGDDPR